MSTLSRRGPGANTPAKLPGIQTSRVEDPATRQAMEALREWVEVRLGSRGDKWERAVTERRLQEVLAELKRTSAADTTTTATAATETVSVESTDLTPLKNRVAQLVGAVAALQSTVEAQQAVIDTLVARTYSVFAQAQAYASGTTTARAYSPRVVASAIGRATVTGVS